MPAPFSRQASFTTARARLARQKGYSLAPACRCGSSTTWSAPHDRRGALESSVTLDEVFTVIGAKRVPLAPELAGYLVLEIAEHADPAGGDVDPRSVFIG